MKYSKKIMGFVILLLMISKVAYRAEAAELVIPKKVTIYTQQVVCIKATIKGKKQKVKWKSSKSKIASVNSNGKIVGKKPGKTVISAQIGGKKAKCNLTVKQLNYKNNDGTIEMSKLFMYSPQIVASILKLSQSYEGTAIVRYAGPRVWRYRNGKWENNYSIELWCGSGGRDIPGKWNIQALYSNQYSLYGMRVGMTFKKCEEILRKKGYQYKAGKSYPSSDKYVFYYHYQKGKNSIEIENRNGICSGLFYNYH